MNYYNTRDKQIYTEQCLRERGVISNKRNSLSDMQDIGYYPVSYDYQLFNVLLQHQEPSELVIDDKNKIAIQKFKIVENTLDDAKKACFEHLSEIFSEYTQYKCKEVFLKSSLGFKINADGISQGYLSGLINQNSKSINFKDYDNEFHTITSEDCKTLLNECYSNMLGLKQQKFDIENKIKQAKVVEELEKIDFNFVMSEF